MLAEILLYITAVIMILCFMVCFMNSTVKDRDKGNRYTDLIAGTLLFLLFLVVIWELKVVGGCA